MNNKKYKIKVNSVEETTNTIDVLIKNGYLFFRLHRCNSLKAVLNHLKRHDVDEVLWVKWLLVGHCDCNRVFGTSSVETRTTDEIFGDTDLYETITVVEFLKLNKK